MIIETLQSIQKIFSKDYSVRTIELKHFELYIHMILTNAQGLGMEKMI